MREDSWAWAIPRTGSVPLSSLSSPATTLSRSVTHLLTSHLDLRLPSKLQAIPVFAVISWYFVMTVSTICVSPDLSTVSSFSSQCGSGPKFPDPLSSCNIKMSIRFHIFFYKKNPPSLLTNRLILFFVGWNLTIGSRSLRINDCPYLDPYPYTALKDSFIFPRPSSLRFLILPWTYSTVFFVGVHSL